MFLYVSRVTLEDLIKLDLARHPALMLRPLVTRYRHLSRSEQPIVFPESTPFAQLAPNDLVLDSINHLRHGCFRVGRESLFFGHVPYSFIEKHKWPCERVVCYMRALGWSEHQQLCCLLVLKVGQEWALHLYFSVAGCRNRLVVRAVDERPLST